MLIRIRSLYLAHRPGKDQRIQTAIRELGYTAGLDVQHEQTKNNLPANQKGYDNFETTDQMLSARRIQI